jgi:hypothetical protein
MNRLSRRKLLKISLAAPLALGARSLLGRPGLLPPEEDLEMLPTTQEQPDGFYRLGKYKDRTWLVAPDGKPFFSIGSEPHQTIFKQPAPSVGQASNKIFCLCLKPIAFFIR